VGKDSRSVISRYTTFLLLGLFKVSYGLYIRLFYRLRSQNKKAIPKKGPYLLLANHSNNFDGLFLQCLINRPIRFVVTDAMFKKKVLGKLMEFVGFIPKRKLVTDSKAIRLIIRAIKDGDIVGIFPEGGRNWDGKTGPISPATYRLAKLLGVPVVTACIKGAYLSEPRWADTKRRGLVEVCFQTHFDNGMKPDLDDIEQQIAAALTHNEADWQRQRKIAFKGKALSKGFERLLFVCPACKRIGALESTDERVRCLACGASYRLDAYGFVHAINGKLPADNTPALHEWQLHHLTSRFFNARPGMILMSDDGARLYCAKSNDQPFTFEESGTLSLKSGSMMIGQRVFDISQMHGISVYFKSDIEFRYNGLDYRIGFSEKRVSAFKWNCALETVKEL
jgi:1-acyl-sn-glycerol-3-phosphate acyltransferase